MGTATDEVTTTTLETVFTVLSDPTRRRILENIRAHNPRTSAEITLEDFVTSNDDRDHLRIELYHAHLPKLASEDFIDWDRKTGTITRGPKFEEICPLLTLLEEHEEKLPGEWSTPSN